MSSNEKACEAKFDKLLDKAYDESVEIVLDIGDDVEKEKLLVSVCEPLANAMNWRNEHNKTVPEFVNEYINRRSKKNQNNDNFIEIMTNIISEIYPGYRFGDVVDKEYMSVSDEDD